MAKSRVDSVLKQKIAFLKMRDNKETMKTNNDKRMKKQLHVYIYIYLLTIRSAMG